MIPTSELAKLVYALGSSATETGSEKLTNKISTVPN
jgi:hypothetical protein